MTDEDIEIIRNAVRDVMAPMERRIIARVQAVEDKLEIMSGVAVRVDGTSQEVAGLRRAFDHLDQRLRRLEEKMPA
jgi:ubiquinone biosynthesis protein UbiJ